MSSCGAVSAFTEFLSELDRVMVIEFVPFVVMVPLDKVDAARIRAGLPDVEFGGGML